MIMRKMLAFAVITIALISCSSNNIPKNSLTEIKENLEGRWKWVKSSGGFAGINQTPETTGESRELLFTEDNTFIEHQAGQITQSGKYDITRDMSLVLHDTTNILKMDNTDYVIISRGDTLRLMQDYYDGLTYIYVKVKHYEQE